MAWPNAAIRHRSRLNKRAMATLRALIHGGRGVQSGVTDFGVVDTAGVTELLLRVSASLAHPLCVCVRQASLEYFWLAICRSSFKKKKKRRATCGIYYYFLIFYFVHFFFLRNVSPSRRRLREDFVCMLFQALICALFSFMRYAS